jgi:hypothetical protein
LTEWANRDKYTLLITERMYMTPEEKREKLKALNERARQKLLMLRESGEEQPVEKNVYVWYNGKLIDMPESVAKKYGHTY